MVGLSWPFWTDLASGNAVTLVAVAAYAALRGGRIAAAVYFALALLVPRPLMLPLLVWLLWKRPETRATFAVLLVINVAAVLATGLADDWIGAALDLRRNLGTVWDIGPSRLLGPLWAPLGLAIAAVLTWRGRVGWASVAAMPYLFPQYLLMLAVEWPIRSGSRR